jgi:hypothetical protein
MKNERPNSRYCRVFVWFRWLLPGVCLLTAKLSADPLAPWAWRTPLPIGNTIGGVAYGNGVIVTVDDTGTILTSPDATNWNIQTVGTGLGLNGLGVLTGVIFAQDQFVAVGAANTLFSQNSGVCTSPDGTNWTFQNVPGSSALLGIGYGSNEYVAVGFYGSMFTSPDGTNWTSVALGTTKSLYGVAYGTNGFVTVGNSGTLATSPDGVSWTLSIVPTNVISGINLSGVAFGSNLYVAVGQYGATVTSPDGANWTKWKNPASQNGVDLNGICYDDGLFVAVGGTIQTSTTGTNWTTVSQATTPGLNTVTYASNEFVAAGPMGAIQMSPTGTTWTSLSTAAVNDDLTCVAFGSNVFVAGGAYTDPSTGNWSFAFRRSVDGVTWSQQVGLSGIASSEISVEGIAFAMNQFVAVGDNGLILTSPDGSNWTSRSHVSDSADNFNGVTYGSNLFVVVGQGGDVRTSPDGVTWTARTPQTGSTLTGVAYGNNEYVAVGYAGTLVTSPDGTNWTSQTPETTDDLNGIAFGGGVFVAVGGFNTVVTSTDGIHWNKTPYPLSDYFEAARAVTYAYGNFVTVGGFGRDSGFAGWLHVGWANFYHG